jgi:hypothetical protein
MFFGAQRKIWSYDTDVMAGTNQVDRAGVAQASQILARGIEIGSDYQKLWPRLYRHQETDAGYRGGLFFDRSNVLVQGTLTVFYR